MSRFGNTNPTECTKENERSSSKRTESSTKFAVTIFNDFLNERGKEDDILSLSVNDLCSLLRDFYANVKSKKGELYKKNSLLNIRQSLNRFFKENDKCFDIINDAEFAVANSTFKGQLRKIRQEGKGNVTHHEPISFLDLQKMYKHKHLFNTETPTGLVNKVIFEIILHFCRKGQQNLSSLSVSDFVIKTGTDNIKYVQKITSEHDKKHQGNTTNSDIDRTTGVRIYATGNDICPVKSFEKYLSKRNKNTDRLFLHPKESFTEFEDVWYKNEPMGVNTLATFMKKMSTVAELSTVYTNHCIRTTNLTLFNHCGFESRHITNVSGHKNQSPLASYCYDASGGPSELFDTENEDWVPSVHLGHDLPGMPKKQGKPNNKKRKTLHKSWVNSEEEQDHNHVLVGSMMVPRVIFDESSDSLTLSKYKNLLSFTISVGEDGDCDIVPKIDDNENTHLELVLIPKAYLNDSGFRQAPKPVTNYDIKVKIEPEDPEYGESAYEGSSNMTSESEIMPESMEEYAPFHSGIGETIPNLVGDNTDYVSSQRLPTTLSEYNSDGSEVDIKPLKLNCNNTCVPESGDSSFQTYTDGSMYIKKEVDDEEEERQGESINQLQSYSNKYFVPKGPKNDTFESKPSILQRNTSKLSVDELFKYLKTKIKLNQTNEFFPWSIQMNTDYILFSQMAPVDFPMVSRQVMLNKDLTYTVRVHAQDLPDKHNIYGSNKKVLKSITDIKHLLKQIDSYNTCSGNHDRRSNHFFLLHSDSDPVHPAIREGNFGGVTMNGTTYEWTIRSKACTLLVKSFLDKCPECNMYYKTAKSAPVPNAFSGE